MAKGKTISQGGVGTILEVSTEGDLDSAFKTLVGADNYDDPGGSATQNTSNNFAQQFASAGGIPPAAFTTDLDPFVALSPVIQTLRKAADDKTSVWVRYTTSMELLLAQVGSRLIKFAIGGVTTFEEPSAPANQKAEDSPALQLARWKRDEYSVGLAFVLKAAAPYDIYPVAEQADDGTPTVVKADFSDLAAAVGGADGEMYAIARPGTRQTMLCRVTNIRKTIPSDGHVNGAITFLPLTVPSPEVPVYDGNIVFP